MLNCIVCNKLGANHKFPIDGKIIILCWSCEHKVRESIMGFNDGVEDLISEDIIVKSIAMQFYQEHKDEIMTSLGGK